MASEEQLRLVREGPNAWNHWRGTHPDLEIDFRDADFTSAEFKDLSFDKFRMDKRATFANARFGSNVDFSSVVFDSDVNFSNAIFEGSINFQNTRFGGLADFSATRFRESADFSSAAFLVEASFDAAHFDGKAAFDSARFSKLTTFRFAKIDDEITFGSAVFAGDVFFDNAVFDEFARFFNAKFQSSGSFHNASFNGVAAFGSNFGSGKSGNTFQYMDFSGAKFYRTVGFSGRLLEGETSFSATFFGQPPDFRDTQNRENLDWTSINFGFGRHLGVGPVSIPIYWSTFSKIVTDLRRLRGIAKEIHAVDAERDLFILERQAERGVLWKNWWHSDWRDKLTDWWRPITSTVLMFFYIVLSGCGRSVWRPIIWFAVANWSYYQLYKHIYVTVTDRPLFVPVKDALFDFTISSALPFGSTARPSFQSAAQWLFHDSHTGLIQIPWQFQFASAGQGIINLVLLFLVGLALRNYFKFR